MHEVADAIRVGVPAVASKTSGDSGPLGATDCDVKLAYVSERRTGLFRDVLEHGYELRCRDRLIGRGPPRRDP
jgi:hypothetical protein